MKANVKHPLKPIYTANSKVLILGSFPSVVSRKKQMYYGHPSNRFWKIMEALFEECIIDHLSFCHIHDIAIWDVIQQCSIKGSQDASIQDIVYNPIEELCQKTKIQHIFCTGKTSYQLFMKYFTLPIPVTCLPSPSSANARQSLEDLIQAYMPIKEFLCQKSNY